MTLDDDVVALMVLMRCIETGKMIELPHEAFDLGQADANDHHTAIVALYHLLDKYECPEFKVDCRQLLSDCVKFCMLESWGAKEFMRLHYDKTSSLNGGHYPKELYPLLAEAWRVMAAMSRPSAELDALIEGDPALTLAIAKCYRARLGCGMGAVAGAKQLMERLAYPEVD